MKRVYLDHAATTPVDGGVLEFLRACQRDLWGNPSSLHWFGRGARAALEEARARVARLIGAAPGEVFFTSGGTEADNLAVLGCARALGRRGRRHLVTSAVEHRAVLDPMRRLTAEGFSLTEIPPEASGAASSGALARALTPHTAFVSLMHANNEVGALSNPAALAPLVHAQGALFHVDAVQTAGRLPLDVRTMGADLLSFSAHKMNGPRGIGALYIRRGTPMEPLLEGGGQERGLRPGTEAVPLAVAFAGAFEIARSRAEGEMRRCARLRDMLEAGIRERFPAALINGQGGERVPHILSVSFDARSIGADGELLAVGMDLEGIAVSGGAACSSGSAQPSHVLRALGRDPDTARATLRFSFGRGNTARDVARALRALERVMRRMKRSP
ncbi:MAG: cysteine desulfurase family protein [Bacteroidota bacterium]